MAKYNASGAFLRKSGGTMTGTLTVENDITIKGDQKALYLHDGSTTVAVLQLLASQAGLKILLGRGKLQLIPVAGNPIEVGNSAWLKDRFLAAGDVLLLGADTERTAADESYTVKKRMYVCMAGTYRVKFDLASAQVGSPYTVYGKVYKNAVAHGTERSTALATFTTFSEDLVFAAGDAIEVFCHVDVGSGESYKVKNFRIYAFIEKNRENCQ